MGYGTVFCIIALLPPIEAGHSVTEDAGPGDWCASERAEAHTLEHAFAISWMHGVARSVSCRSSREWQLWALRWIRVRHLCRNQQWRAVFGQRFATCPDTVDPDTVPVHELPDQIGVPYDVDRGMKADEWERFRRNIRSR